MEVEDAHQAADTDGLLHQGRHEARGGHGHVHAPGLIEEPLALGVVDARDRARHPVLGLGQQGDDQVGLVIPGGGHDNVAGLSPGALQGVDVAGVGQLPVGLRDRGDAHGLGGTVDEGDLVAVADELAGDGTAHGSGSGDDDLHGSGLLGRGV